MNLSGFSTSGRFWGFDYTIHTSESYLLHNLRSSSFPNLLQRKRVKGGGNSFSEEFFNEEFWKQFQNISWLLWTSTCHDTLMSWISYLLSFLFLITFNIRWQKEKLWLDFQWSERRNAYFIAKLKQTKSNKRQYTLNGATECKVTNKVRDDYCFLDIIIYSHSLQHFYRLESW